MKKPLLHLVLVVAAIAAVLAHSAGPAAAQTAEPGFVPLSPSRVLDTRSGTGAPAGPLGPGATIDLQITGIAGVPDDAAEVVLNVTSTEATLPSFITVWPFGQDRPNASSLNTEPGQDTPNLVMVAVGDGGKVSLYNDQGSGHLVADVTGYFTPGSGFEGTTPARLLDTRQASDITAGQPVGSTPIRLVVAGAAGVPANASAAVLNITSTQATAPSFVTVWPDGEARPNASSLNTEPGQDTPNLAVVALGAGGAVDLFNSAGTTHLVVDVTGYITEPEAIVTASPTRLLDTRTGLGVPTGVVSGGTSIDVQVAGVAGVPDDATAVVLNVTSTEATAPSFITVWPEGETRPNASSLNTEPGQDTPNLTFVKLGSTGAISLYNSTGATHLVADVAGWTSGEAPITTPKVHDLDFFRGRGERDTEDFGLSRASAWRWNGDTRTAEAHTTAGALAVGENFNAEAAVYSPFQPYRANGEVTFDVEWWGTMTSFVGADANARATVTVRLYEMIRGPVTTPGPVVWETVLEDDGVGAGLQAISVDQLEGRVVRTVELPTLDPSGSYRLEAEIHCNTRVVFSIGATSCDFYTGDRGITVHSWSIEYDEGVCPDGVNDPGCV